MSERDMRSEKNVKGNAGNHRKSLCRSMITVDLEQSWSSIRQIQGKSIQTRRRLNLDNITIIYIIAFRDHAHGWSRLDTSIYYPSTRLQSFKLQASKLHHLHPPCYITLNMATWYCIWEYRKIFKVVRWSHTRSLYDTSRWQCQTISRHRKLSEFPHMATGTSALHKVHTLLFNRTESAYQWQPFPTTYYLLLILKIWFG